MNKEKQQKNSKEKISPYGILPGQSPDGVPAHSEPQSPLDKPLRKSSPEMVNPRSGVQNSETTRRTENNQ